MFSIGIDIGGMSIKVGLVDEKGNIVGKNSKKTEKTAELCIKNMIEQINELLSKYGLTDSKLNGIGIGCPGAVSSEKGLIEFLPNLGWKNINIKKELQKKFNTKIEISNDANVATLAEAVYGVARNYDSFIMLTLGTGVGGGIVIDKKLYEGIESKGAELGHTTLVLNGKKCSCGRNGCVEQYVSATALIEQTKEEMLKNKDSMMWNFVCGEIEKVDGKTAFDCAKKGDKSAVKVRDNYVMYLSESILNFLNIFRPQAIVLGGGISAQGKYLTDLITDYIEKFNYGYMFSPKTKILTAKFGNDSGIIGAVALLS